ncbi:MAG: hypothetical protein KTR29_09660 [Rhodothermaceae bacterium]|nr:hypothetical protein [Rhodothermaceae bacterium]
MHRPRHYLTCSLFVLVLTLFSHQAFSQDGMLWQAEIYQGGTFVEGVDPYSFSLRLQPTFGSNATHYGPSIALAYTNPDWAGQFGIQASFNVFDLDVEGVDAVLLHLGIEGLWESESFLGTQNRGMIGPKLKLDTGAFQLGIRVNYDYITEAWGMGGWLGLGLNTLFGSGDDRDPLDATSD